MLLDNCFLLIAFAWAGQTHTLQLQQVRQAEAAAFQSSPVQVHKCLCLCKPALLLQAPCHFCLGMFSLLHDRN